MKMISVNLGKEYERLESVNLIISSTCEMSVKKLYIRGHSRSIIERREERQEEI